MMYTVRNLGTKTKGAISAYANEHNLTMAEAISQLVEFGLEYYNKNKKPAKKYASAEEALKIFPSW